MVFQWQQKVLFKHCDPAGIVFFPRYFEMMNDCIETFFSARLEVPFETLHKQAAVPTAQIETRFTRPSYHGDVLDFYLTITKVGGSSARYEMRAFCRDELRFETGATLVYVNDTGRPTPWPEALRSKLKHHEVSEHGT